MLQLLTFAQCCAAWQSTLVVFVKRETQVARLMSRENISRDRAEEKIAAQMPLERKRALATDVIDNEGEIDALGPKLDAWYRRATGRRCLPTAPAVILAVAAVFPMFVLRWLWPLLLARLRAHSNS